MPRQYSGDISAKLVFLSLLLMPVITQFCFNKKKIIFLLFQDGELLAHKTEMHFTLTK